ncbi:MAG: Histidinol dehydrogenase, partial [Planctomycetota bacterium]
IRLAESDLRDLAADIATLADVEGLTAHRRSVSVRLERS